MAIERVSNQTRIVSGKKSYDKIKDQVCKIESYDLNTTNSLPQSNIQRFLCAG